MIPAADIMASPVASQSFHWQ